ncbi:hypothetical protein [Pedobacter metabolipauper]|uniref:Uncharacterized protein n=1 Tax=Pedobacter metabolipauper TaxID=425513 RepID=A0A4R6SSN5_9SPHI|nr:hypothetical protein [Pedobacter metabolipauper]TDQ06923.1 hypothetical protein ATK78_3936 [Pedobacter metabolipauper]
MKFSEDTILHACPLILRWTLSALVEVSLKKALKVELKDFTGLIDPEETSDLDLELLSELDNPNIDNVIEIVNLIHNSIHIFLIINNITEEDCEDNEEAFELAEDFYHLFYIISDEFNGTENGNIEISWGVLNTLCLLYELGNLIIDKEYDLDEENSGDFMKTYVSICNDRDLLYRGSDHKNLSVINELYKEVEQRFML